MSLSVSKSVYLNKGFCSEKGQIFTHKHTCIYMHKYMHTHTCTHAYTHHCTCIHIPIHTENDNDFVGS